MAKDETKRIKPSILEEDKDSFAGLKTIPNYQPANAAYSVTNITAAETEMLTAQETLAQAEAALATARDNATAAEWKYHNLILGSKDQVVAQFGRNSNQVQLVNRKKSSEYRRPGRKSSKG
jgi:hypothetical protein